MVFVNSNVANDAFLAARYSKVSKSKLRISNFTLTKYKLQHFVTIHSKLYAVYSVRPMRHVLKTELKQTKISKCDFECLGQKSL